MEPGRPTVSSLSYQRTQPNTSPPVHHRFLFPFISEPPSPFPQHTLSSSVSLKVEVPSGESTFLGGINRVGHRKYPVLGGVPIAWEEVATAFAEFQLASGPDPTRPGPALPSPKRAWPRPKHGWPRPQGPMAPAPKGGAKRSQPPIRCLLARPGRTRAHNPAPSLRSNLIGIDRQKTRPMRKEGRPPSPYPLRLRESGRN